MNDIKFEIIRFDRIALFTIELVCLLNLKLVIKLKIISHLDLDLERLLSRPPLSRLLLLSRPPLPLLPPLLISTLTL